MAFGGKTRDLGSIGEEMDKTATLHQSLLKNSVECLETALQFLAMASYHTSNGVKISKTASEHSRLKRNPRGFSGATMPETFNLQLLRSITSKLGKSLVTKEVVDPIHDDAQRIWLVSMHVFNKALNWHKQFIKKFHENVTWKRYETKVKRRFDSVFEDPMEMEEDGDMQLTEEGVMNACTTNLIDEPPMISLNALSRENTYRTMRVKGFVRKNVAHTLIDCGNTHNFLYWNTARKLRCKLRKISPLEVSMENGHVMNSLYECKDFS
ncbi:hypothetical protein Tco_0390030 [Tanacetum coccineum]